MARRSPLPEIPFARVKRFCDGRIPPELRPEIRLEVQTRGNAVTIVERRPNWGDPAAEWTSQKIAQLRYDEAQRVWSLYWPRASGRWHPYQDIEPAEDVDVLLSEIGRDPWGVFWG